LDRGIICVTGGNGVAATTQAIGAEGGYGHQATARQRARSQRGHLLDGPRIGAPLLLIIAAPVGILLTWLCWALIWETGVFVFGRHWRIVVAAVILYLVIMEVLERIRRRERK